MLGLNVLVSMFAWRQLWWEAGEATGAHVTSNACRDSRNHGLHISWHLHFHIYHKQDLIPV